MNETAAAANRVYDGLIRDEDKVLARRLFLRLVRLRPTPEKAGPGDNASATTTEFDAVPASRGALHDRGDPDRVDTLVTAFADAGVLRVTAGETPAADQITLRSVVVMDRWDRMKAWMGERREIRRRADAWNEAPDATPVLGRGGRFVHRIIDAFATATDTARHRLYRHFPRLDFAAAAREKLLRGEDLEDARTYHDRSGVERDYIEESRFEEKRSEARNRLLLGLFGILFVAALVGWCVSLVSLGYARQETRAAKDAQSKADATAYEALNRLRLSSLRVLIRGWADVAAARSDATARSEADLAIARARWISLTSQTPLKSALESAINVPQVTDRVNSIVRRPATDDSHNFEQLGEDTGSFIRDVHRIRDELLDQEPMYDALVAVRETAFDIVRLTARRAAEGIAGSKPTTEISPFVREFWKQYWGEMLLVESRTVEGKMVAFGTLLNTVWPAYRTKSREPVAPGQPKPELVDPTLAKALLDALKDLEDALNEEQRRPFTKRS